MSYLSGAVQAVQAAKVNLLQDSLGKKSHKMPTDDAPSDPARKKKKGPYLQNARRYSISRFRPSGTYAHKSLQDNADMKPDRRTQNFQFASMSSDPLSFKLLVYPPELVSTMKT